MHVVKLIVAGSEGSEQARPIKERGGGAQVELWVEVRVRIRVGVRVRFGG